MRLRHRESGQIVESYGLVPYLSQVGEPIGGDFLVFTSDGWDFRSVEDFEPVDQKHALELENDNEEP